MKTNHLNKIYSNKKKSCQKLKENLSPKFKNLLFKNTIDHNHRKISL